MSSADRSVADKIAAEIDTTNPSIARVYDAFIGGKDNYEVDRAVLREVQRIAPEAVQTGRLCRQWLIRTVRFMTGHAGITQFLDCGSGLPTAENTHQAAQRLNPEARTVYIDNDPMVAAHGRALLEENDRTHFAAADLTEPRALLEDPVVTKHIDFDQPIGLIHCNTLHHVADEADPTEIMRYYVDALPSGSFVALCHLFHPGDGSGLARMAEDSQERFQRLMGTCYYRDRAQIESFFSGLEMVEPGLTELFNWWPDGPLLAPPNDEDRLLLGGVARKP
ncbi:SAM-dependent methyltransferase [Parasphingorhabdus pacifica]